MQRTGQTTRPMTQLRTWSSSAALLAVGLGCALLGCGSADAPSLLTQGTLDVQSIGWSQPLPAMPTLGRVQAVAEAGDDVALWSEGGVFLYSSGDSAGSDGSVRAWRGAAAVPALGLAGQWLLGVDQTGVVYRLHTGATFGLEDVTARYLLTDLPVREVAALGNGQVAFALETQLMVSDGTTRKLYDVALRNLTGGSGRLAAYDDTGVRIFDPQSGKLRQLALAGVLGIALSPDGQLWAATATTLYAEKDGALVQAYAVTSPQTITALAGAARGVWVGLGDTLALIRDGQLLVAPAGSGLSAGTRLLGSPSGDVWTLGGSDGQLGRYGEPSGGGRDLELWRQKLTPIFSRVCQSCHLPAGSAHIDMSTYSSWASRRARVGARVIDRLPTPMPPESAGTLTAAELEDVKAWVARMP